MIICKIKKKYFHIAVLLCVSLIFSVVGENTAADAQTYDIMGTFCGVNYAWKNQLKTISAVGFDSSKLVKTSTCEAGELKIPTALGVSGTIRSVPICGIEEDIFSGQSVARVVMACPEGLSAGYYIGDGAFANMKVEEYAGSSVTVHDFTIDTQKTKLSIGTGAFQGIRVDGNLSITNMRNVTIGENAFKDAVIKGTLKLNGENVSLGKYALSGLNCAISYGGSTIASVGDYCCQGVSWSYFRFPPACKNIGSKIFDNAPNMSRVELPPCDDMESVAEDAFPDRSDFRIVIPKSVINLSAYHIENYKKTVFDVDESLTDDSSVIVTLKNAGVYWKKGESGELMHGYHVAAEEEPTPTPTFVPTEAPTVTPTIEPTLTPTFVPTTVPTTVPTQIPTIEPIVTPTIEPTLTPTLVPTEVPTIAPTEAPTVTPTIEPTVTPTIEPTQIPTEVPTQIPTEAPTVIPTIEPTLTPTLVPTFVPTQVPTIAPTLVPTQIPTEAPTVIPTIEPTLTPTLVPTQVPTVIPTIEPTLTPTLVPTQVPTIAPTVIPTIEPTLTPTFVPTEVPTQIPTEVPTQIPTEAPTVIPTIAPTEVPTIIPTEAPTVTPTIEPTLTPTEAPTEEPTQIPTEIPTQMPTEAPTALPTRIPTEGPTPTPALLPSEMPISPTIEEPTQFPAKTPIKSPTKYYKLKEIKYLAGKNNTVTVVGLANKTSDIKKLKIPDIVKIKGHLYKVTAIRKSAFAKNGKLRSVSVGNYVKTIGDCAFAGCKNLKKISFGRGVKSIGKKVLSNNIRLRSISFLGNKLNKIGKKTFYKVPKNVDIRIPSAKAKRYKKIIRSAA